MRLLLWPHGIPPWIPQTAPWPQWNPGLSITENPPWIGTSHNFTDLLFISQWNIPMKYHEISPKKYPIEIFHWNVPFICYSYPNGSSGHQARPALLGGLLPLPGAADLATGGAHGGEVQRSGSSWIWGSPSMGVSKNAWFFFRENPSYKWMITGGTMA